MPDQTSQVIEGKVAEALLQAPRIQASNDGVHPYSAADREKLLRISFAEIARATSIDVLSCAPAAMLEQLSVLALTNNANVNGILTQVIRVFMALWATPETHQLAMDHLKQMEQAMAQVLVGASNEVRKSVYGWKPQPQGMPSGHEGAVAAGVQHTLEQAVLAERMRCVDIVRTLTSGDGAGVDQRHHTSHQARALASDAVSLIGSTTAERQWRAQIHQSNQA